MTELIEIVTPTIEETKAKLEAMYDIDLYASVYDMGTYKTYSLKQWSPFYLDLSWGAKIYKTKGEDPTEYWYLTIAKSDSSTEIYYRTPSFVSGPDDWQTVVREMGRYCKLRKVEQQRLF